MRADLRTWLERMHAAGELRELSGASADLEIPAVTRLSARQGGPALLFSHVPGFDPDDRVLTNATASSPRRLVMTLNLADGDDPATLGGDRADRLVRAALPRWRAMRATFGPRAVEGGPVLENVWEGEKVNVTAFPAPRWRALEPAPYIGTADAVITRDPETGAVSLGAYRVMCHDDRSVAVSFTPGHDGALHLRKYHDAGVPAPVAIVAGGHPVLHGVASLPLPGGQEYEWAGAILGEPVEVVTDEETGLPVPAHAEVVLVGHVHPWRTVAEGPFGEWTGYYAPAGRSPLVDVTRVYHRDAPVLLGHASGLDIASQLLHNELEQLGIPGVHRVSVSHQAGPMLIVLAVRQLYAGHAKRAALLASQSSVGSPGGRYVIVVDDDIDPTSLDQVLWAVATRSDPAQDLDVIRGCWSTPLDPTLAYSAPLENSRAIIDACRPYERLRTYPRPWKYLPEPDEEALRSKWGTLLDL